MHLVLHALRSLRKSPGFTLAALFLLGLGIGLNTSIVSLIDALLYRPAPFVDPHTLVGLHGASARTDEGFGSVSGALTIREVDFIRDNVTTLRDLAILDGRDATLLERDQPAEFVHGQAVSVETLPTLGVSAALGRTLTPDDFRPDAPPALLISHNFWQRRFAADRAVLGRTLRFSSGDQLTIVGVMPPTFDYPLLWNVWGETCFWRPLVLDASVRALPDNRRFQIVARLRDGVSLAQARAELTAVAERFDAARSQPRGTRLFRVTSLHAAVVPPFYRELVWLVYGVSATLLLMACTNLAGLQLARLLGRSRELAIRSALGASRVALTRQLAVESALLVLGGAALGLVVALAGNALLEQHVLVYGARGLDLALNGRVLALVGATTLATTVLFGVVPAWASSRVNVNDTLKQQNRATTAGRAHQRLRRAFIAGQIALALVLLTGASMLERGFHTLLRRDLGWQPEGLVTAELSLSPARYEDRERQRSFYRDVQARFAAEPGVEAFAVANQLPLTTYWAAQPVISPDAPDQPPVQAYSVVVTPGYFETLRVPLLEGRTFLEDIQPDDPPTIVINAALARRVFPGRSAVGQRLGFRSGNTVTWREVIGVVADVTLVGNPAATTPPLQIHQPAVRTPVRYMNLVVRGPSAVDLAATLRRVIGQIDPELTLRNVQSLPEFVDRELGNLRRVGHALSIFALLGLLLTAVGLYAVVSDFVGQRRGEFGVRLALGAQRRDIFALVVGSATRLTLLGLTIGFAAAWGVARLLVSLLPNLVAAGPAFFATLGGVLAVIALLACCLPARRATRVDPIVALRAE